MKRKKITATTQRNAVDKYREKVKQKPIGTTFEERETNTIKATFKANGVTVGEVLRGAAFALMNGETIPTRSEPLPIPTQDESTDGNE